MLSEMAALSIDEPWFALSNGKYKSILNEALSEMEVHESEMELSNCTELIKLLNQDDGLGNEIGPSLLPSPPEASNFGLGVTPVKSVQNNSRNAKEVPRNPAGTGLTVTMGRVSSQMLGRAQRKRLTCKKNLFDPFCESSRNCSEGTRIQSRCAHGKVSETVGKKILEVPTRGNTTVNGHNRSHQIRNELLSRRGTLSRNPTPVLPNNSHCSRRIPKPFSLESDRRSSTVFDDRCFQGHRLLGHSLNEKLTVNDGVVIPNPDLSHAEVFQHVKVDGEWRSSCLDSLPYATFASRSRSVKVELEDTVSGRKLEQSVPRRNSETTLVWCDWKREGEMHSPAQGGVVNLSLGATPHSEVINTVHSDLSGISRRPTARGFSLEAGGLRPKSNHRQQKFVVGKGAEHTSSSWFNGIHSAAKTKHGNNGSLRITREVQPTSPGSGKTYQDIGKKVTSFDSSQLSLFGTSYESGRNREDAKTWKTRSELWVAIDKLMVRSMMHQILSEESAEALNFQPQQQRLKDEVGHSCLTELHNPKEVDRILPVEAFEDFRLSVLNQVSNVQPSTHAEKPNGQRFVRGLDGTQRSVNVELLKADPNQDAAYDLRTKLSAGDKIFSTSESFCDGNTPDPVNRTKIDSIADRLPVAPSLFGETGSGGRPILPKADAVKFNTQKIGLSRMSFKWKSNILHRLRKDQITANNWRLSETLSV